jgi:hypothetical protein
MSLPDFLTASMTAFTARDQVAKMPPSSGLAAMAFDARASSLSWLKSDCSDTIWPPASPTASRIPFSRSRMVCSANGMPEHGDLGVRAGRSAP